MILTFLFFIYHFIACFLQGTSNSRLSLFYGIEFPCIYFDFD